MQAGYCWHIAAGCQAIVLIPAWVLSLANCSHYQPAMGSGPAGLLYSATPAKSSSAGQTGVSSSSSTTALAADSSGFGLDDYDYQLPEERIARYPLTDRSASRLLQLPAGGGLADRQIRDLPALLQPGDVLVLNDTRVMNARLRGRRESGGQVEVLVERIVQPDQALVHLKTSNKPRPGAQFYFDGPDRTAADSLPVTEIPAGKPLVATFLDRQDSLFRLQFDQPLLPALTHYGELPIPPYFERPAEQLDQARYQTVFADPHKTASAAAPTAGLHLDHELLQQLQDSGIVVTHVTLHVGAGTFQPVRTADIRQHQMHREWAEVSDATVRVIQQARAAGGQVVAVGTTATRALESAARSGTLRPWTGETDIFIYPGFEFRVIDRLLTNFHLPQSSLLMLVSALAGRDRIMAAYQHAIDQGYRFFSYGDAMLIDRVRPAHSGA